MKKNELLEAIATVGENKVVTVVHDENTLGYAFLSGGYLSMGILGNTLGGRNWQKGQMPLSDVDVEKSLRFATKDDFDNFKVMYSSDGYALIETNNSLN